MVKTKNFKKNLGKGLLAGALALSLAVPTFAAVDTVQDIDKKMHWQENQIHMYLMTLICIVEYRHIQRVGQIQQMLH